MKSVSSDLAEIGNYYLQAADYAHEFKAFIYVKGNNLAGMRAEQIKSFSNETARNQFLQDFYNEQVEVLNKKHVQNPIKKAKSDFDGMIKEGDFFA